MKLILHTFTWAVKNVPSEAQMHKVPFIKALIFPSPTQLHTSYCITGYGSVIGPAIQLDRKGQAEPPWHADWGKPKH